MNLSIITPHFNDFVSIKHLHACLLKQDTEQWEWIIVDDFSDQTIRELLSSYFQHYDSPNIKLVLNDIKTSGSVCRNIGVNYAAYNNLVFLDSDDTILKDFVSNRLFEFKDFAILPNFKIINKKGEEQYNTLNGNLSLLDKFLSAQFLWQTTCLLWDKDFFKSIGKFNPKLPRLQDVELSIRALQNSTQYTVLDNPVDFYYNVKPIRERQNFVKPVCVAVHILISELLDTSNLKKEQLHLLSGYYFQCVRYLERSESTTDISLVATNLKLFRQKRYIGQSHYILGALMLKLYGRHLVSPHLFLRINRYLFKPKTLT